MKLSYSTYSLLGLLLLSPLIAKVGTPLIQHQALQALSNQLPQSDYQVVEIKDGDIMLRSPQDTHRQVHLSGLEALPPHWEAQATGTLGMLTQNTTVSVQCLHQCEPGETEEALVSLPNGTLLETVLLSDGLGKLDPEQLQSLPYSVSSTLQSAQATAQQQHKNVWGM
jgi:hypothetical protein